jgi:hypothetical protein
MLEPHPDYIRTIVLKEDKENRELLGIDIAKAPKGATLEEYLSDAKIAKELGTYLYDVYPLSEIRISYVDLVNTLQHAMYHFKLNLKK